MMRLNDEADRRRALTDHDSTLLVEAGAGSGKTALMAGRVVAMLAAGRAPASIAAITFTELAAGELLGRITQFLDTVLAGGMPVDIELAFPDGITPEHQDNLQQARALLGELTVSTIHGFCQALLRPYPVEASMDPGAQIMDDLDRALAWDQLFADFLRRRLDSGEDGSALGAFVLATSGDAAARLREFAGALRLHRTATVVGASFEPACLQRLTQAVGAFVDWVGAQDCHEETTDELARDFRQLDECYAPLASGGRNDAGLVFELALNPPRIAAHVGKGERMGAWRRKTKWVAAARAAGLSKAHGEQLSAEGNALYDAVSAAWQQAQAMLGEHAFSEFATELTALLDEYADYKRAAALLDFDDLLLHARDLLRRDVAVRAALSARFSTVLVDEFQDTDPVQAEVLWLLCGDGDCGQAWIERQLRPGALFAVGDPKQAIYRFRGADVDTYVQARDAIRTQLPDNVLAITSNFRSLAPILDWVNVHFAEPLGADRGQPGFAALDAVRVPVDDTPHVVALDVELPDKAPVSDRRDAEAAAVAELCGQLIGAYPLPGPPARALEAGDIALLAPTGTELWRYERALEKAGIPVASQAGKGFFARQEIQDLIAVARTLADARDTVALGALLRGPLVGLTEEELLDIVAAIPADADGRDIARLTLWTDPEVIVNPVAREVLRVMQGLARKARGTTPFALLSQAVEELRVRPLLALREPRATERVLANVDLFLEFAQPYQVSGLQAFASAMRVKWEDAESQIEGRPDAQQHAVQLITVHSAKGLEWPVVIPVNMFSDNTRTDAVLHDRSTETLHHCLGPVASERYAALKDQEKAQGSRESMRLLYVACTRAQELLVLPRPTVTDSPRLADLALAAGELPTLDPDGLAGQRAAGPSGETNAQARSTFAEEAERVVSATPSIVRRSPSRHETVDESRAATSSSIESFGDGLVPAALTVRGGAVRGTLLHKMMEEVLNGEVGADEVALESRAEDLMAQLGLTPSHDPADGISTTEVAGCVLRGIAVPQVAALRARLVPEVPLRASQRTDGTETITSGIADAVALSEAGQVSTVIDWKSDVAASDAQRQLHAEQVRDYLRVVGAAQGLVVYLSTGRVDEVRV